MKQTLRIIPTGNRIVSIFTVGVVLKIILHHLVAYFLPKGKPGKIGVIVV